MAVTQATLAVSRAILKEAAFLEAKEFAKSSLERRFVRVDSTTQEFERYKSLKPIGIAEEVAEGGAVVFKDAENLYTKDFYPVMYRNATSVTLQAERTDQYGVIKQFARQLVRSLDWKKEKSFIDTFFNRGFSASYLGMDGVALYSTVHPQGTGPTWSNRGASALNSVNLGVAKELVRARRDPANYPMPFHGQHVLVVPTALTHTAAQLLGSTLVPENANNGSNVYRNDVSTWVTSPYLDDTNAWFLIPEGTGAANFVRLDGAVGRNAHTWFDNNLLKTAWGVYEQYVHLWTSPDHTYGDEGA